MTYPGAKPAPKPFIKWVGGKTQLLPKIAALLPTTIESYFEPFVGGGAVFFHLAAEHRLKNRVVLSDASYDLINCYRHVRDSVGSIIQALNGLPVDEETYYELREAMAPTSKRLTETERAAVFIYLNKTCFNGLYRVNQQGVFNASWGKYPPDKAVYDSENLLACSRALQGVDLVYEYFDGLPYCCGEEDAFYFDPPYVPVSKTADFTSYTQDGFGKKEQENLAKRCRQLKERGIPFVASNADCSEVRTLYAWATIHEVQARRSVNTRGDGRGLVGEVLITA